MREVEVIWFCVAVEGGLIGLEQLTENDFGKSSTSRVRLAVAGAGQGSRKEKDALPGVAVSDHGTGRRGEITYKRRAQHDTSTDERSATSETAATRSGTEQYGC